MPTMGCLIVSIPMDGLFITLGFPASIEKMWMLLISAQGAFFAGKEHRLSQEKLRKEFQIVDSIAGHLPRNCHKLLYG